MATPQQSIRDLSYAVTAGGVPSCIRYPQAVQGKKADFEL